MAELLFKYEKLCANAFLVRLQVKSTTTAQQQAMVKGTAYRLDPEELPLFPVELVL